MVCAIHSRGICASDKIRLTVAEEGACLLVLLGPLVEDIWTVLDDARRHQRRACVR